MRPVSKILVVDDSAAMRRVIRRSLERVPQADGAVIIEAADGREALAVATAEAPDLILSDWSMPEMTGIELLRALHDVGIRCTFGFVTSEPTSEMRGLAVSHGARFVLSKPVTADSLAEALADL